MGKNLQRVQDMVDGNYKSKIQVGYGDQEIEHREVGDIWTDSDGDKWEQKQGYKMKISRTPGRGIADKCNTCESFILRSWDKDTYKADGRCYHCQINYELDLQFDKPLRWFAYRRLKDLKNMESLHNDMEKFVFEKHEYDTGEKIFDKSVANAIANENVEMTINKNKSMQ